MFWIIGVGDVECLDVAQRNPRAGDCGGEAVRRPRTRGILTLAGRCRMPGCAGTASARIVGGSGWSRDC
jgi:hypothetical protein